MPTRCQQSSFRFFLCLLVVTMLSGCASRKIVTAVEDQSTVPGPAPETKAPVAAAEVSPPVPPEPPKAEEPAPVAATQVSPPAPPEPPKTEQPAPVELVPVEPVQPAPIQPEQARIEKPTTPPEVEETRVVEQAPAPAPPPGPAVQPAQPMAELSDIFFDFDRFTVRGDAQSVLDANAGILKLKPDHQIVIEGHCDERGTSAYNFVLGERRAQSVKQYLEVLGVPASQIRITSYGKERPFCTEHSEDCWQSNRRAHFRHP